MNKFSTISLVLLIALAFFGCDDGTKKETPSVPQPKTITQANGLAFDGKVTISSPDEHLPSAWNALCNDVVTALNSAYTSAGNGAKSQFATVFANDANAQIVLVNNLANNYEVKDGEFSTMYLKTSSIATAAYGNAVQRMVTNTPAVGKATSAKDRVALATVTRQRLTINET